MTGAVVWEPVDGPGLVDLAERFGKAVGVTLDPWQRRVLLAAFADVRVARVNLDDRPLVDVVHLVLHAARAGRLDPVRVQANRVDVDDAMVFVGFDPAGPVPIDRRTVFGIPLAVDGPAGVVSVWATERRLVAQAGVLW